MIDRINTEQERLRRPMSQEERFRLMDEIICKITPENKVNLFVFDGELFYVHTNYKNSLHWCWKEDALVISTRPLGKDSWGQIPMNTLLAYQDGELRYTGTNHGNEFIESEEKMRLLFLDFANL